VSHRWQRSVRIIAAAGLAVLLGQSLVPRGASAVDPAVVHPGALDPTAVAAHQTQGKPALLKPNLVVLKAADLSVQRTGNGRYLRFESALGNIGRGPIEVRPNTNQPCPTGHHHATQIIYRDVDGSRFYRRSVDTQIARRSAGCMVYHPAHNHWHFQAASRYTLFQPGDERNLVRVARRKMSFCLRDSERIPRQYGSYHQREFYGACSKYSPQGISIGWVDVYQSFLAGQALRLPRSARDGLYCLRIKVDPKNQLVESDDRDNTSMRAFSLHGDAITFRRVGRCT
jgi:Lysyl oxidase